MPTIAAHLDDHHVYLITGNAPWREIDYSAHDRVLELVELWLDWLATNRPHTEFDAHAHSLDQLVNGLLQHPRIPKWAAQSRGVARDLFRVGQLLDLRMTYLAPAKETAWCNESTLGRIDNALGLAIIGRVQGSGVAFPLIAEPWSAISCLSAELVWALPFRAGESKSIDQLPTRWDGESWVHWCGECFWLVRDQEARKVGERRVGVLIREAAHQQVISAQALGGDVRFERETLSTAVRRAVWVRDGGRCQQCGADYDLLFDHIIPISKGGSSTAENLQLLCASCNRSKGARI